MKDYIQINIGGKTPTKEQWCIIENLKEGKDCVSDSVPGGGKSTTCYFISFTYATLYPSKKILNLTFSSDLKKESRARIKELKIQNMDVESYNSFAHNFYGQGGVSPNELYEIINKNLPATRKVKYDLIILDEMQDMQLIFYKLINKYIKDIGFRPQLFVIGDKFQGIFEFKGADIRFLTCCNQIFQREFVNCPLTLSRRLTNPMGRFINDVILNEKRIITDKPGPQVQYLIYNPYSEELLAKLGNTILMFFEKGSGPEDIFILAPTLKNGSPISILNRKLSSLKIPICWADNSEDTELKEEHMKGKIVMTSFHKSKGRERPINIVYGIDESYYHFGREDLSQEKCPEPIFVALSRGLERLIIIHSYDNNNPRKKYRKLPFIRKSIKEISQLPYCKVRKQQNIKFKDLEYGTNKTIVNNSEQKYDVTDIIKYLDDISEKELLPYDDILYDSLKPPNNGVHITTDIVMGDLTENVSDLNGIAIPALWEFLMRGEMTIYDKITTKLYSESTLLKEELKKIVYPSKNICDILRLANIYKTITSGVEHNLNQVQGFDWVGQNKVDICLQNLNEQVNDKDIKFEVSLHYVYEHPDFGIIEFNGIVDAVTSDYVYEFKCVNQLSFSHKLQLILYAWLWKQIYPEDNKKFILFNIYTCEILELDAKHYALEDVVDILINNKLKSRDLLSDEEFIRMCLDENSQIPVIENNYINYSDNYLLDTDEED